VMEHISQAESIYYMDFGVNLKNIEAIFWITTVFLQCVNFLIEGKSILKSIKSTLPRAESFHNLSLTNWLDLNYYKTWTELHSHEFAYTRTASRK
jgi:hypothetical protein